MTCDADDAARLINQTVDEMVQLAITSPVRDVKQVAILIREKADRLREQLMMEFGYTDAQVRTIMTGIDEKMRHILERKG